LTTRLRKRQDPDIRVPCPVCGRRILDTKGSRIEGDAEIEVKCRGACGFVWINANYLQMCLTNKNPPERL